MSDKSYQLALEDARREMNRLLQQRVQLDSRLTQLKSTIDVLSALVNEPPKLGAEGFADVVDTVGISASIRLILAESGVGLTPVQIKNKLGEFGFGLDQYANAGAVIYNTLKRLERQGEIVPVRDSSGATAYALAPVTISHPAPDSFAAKDARGELAQARERFKAATDKRRLRSI